MSNEARITDYRAHITDYPRVSIIVLNWNGWRDTIECLESVYQITYPNYDVIVVDNGSSDESIEKIKEYCEGKIKVESKFFEYSSENKPIKIIEYTREEAEAGGGKEEEISKLPSNRKLILIKNEKNYGFAEGNNIGIRYALKALNPDYVLLLNNDTVVDREFLGELVRVAEQNKVVGVVGPIIYFYDRPTMIQSMGGKINMWTGRRKHIARIGNNKDDIMEVDFVPGTCLLIKKEVIKRVGMLDKEYFAYVEDIDWCFRIKQQGYIIITVLKSAIWHKGSKSTGGGFNPTVQYYMARNNFLFMKKNAKLYHIPSSLIFLSYYFVKRLLINVLKEKDLEKARSMIKGILSNFKRKYDE